MKTRVYNIHKVKNVFGSMFQITCFSMWKNINIILQLKYVLEFVKVVDNFAIENCSLKRVTRVCHNSIWVLTNFGAILDFKGPIKAQNILDDHLGYGIFWQGQASSPLQDLECLISGRLYYLLPLSEEHKFVKMGSPSKWKT